MFSFFLIFSTLHWRYKKLCAHTRMNKNHCWICWKWSGLCLWLLCAQTEKKTKKKDLIQYNITTSNENARTQRRARTLTHVSQCFNVYYTVCVVLNKHRTNNKMKRHTKKQHEIYLIIFTTFGMFWKLKWLRNVLNSVEGGAAANIYENDDCCGNRRRCRCRHRCCCFGFLLPKNRWANQVKRAVER